MRFECGVGRRMYICARFPGTINLSSPTNALPVAFMRFSPAAVRGSSVVPVCLPLSDHSVSPCRIMKTRGSGIAFKREGCGWMTWTGVGN